jgi:aminobenzoyl-glutamate utilization protein B
MVMMGDQPNVITSYAKIWWMFREASAELVKDIWAKGRKVAEGAALMTNTTVEENLLSAVWPSRANYTVSEVVYANIQLVGMPKWTAEEQALAKAIQKMNGADEIGLRTEVGSLRKATQGASANDSGDVTWVLPSSSIGVPGGVSGTIGHHWSAAIAQGTSIANQGEVTGAKYLAGSMIDVLENPELVAEAKATFKEEIAGTEYVSLMPPDQKAPTFLNKEKAARWKPLLEPFYLREEIVFK